MPQGRTSSIKTALSRAWSRTLSRVLSFWVRPHALPETISDLIDASRPILYVLETGGLADRTALGLITRQLGLPSPGRDLLVGELRERSRVTVLLHNKRHGWLSRIGFGRLQHVSSRRLHRVVYASLALPDTAEDLQVVPVSIYWGRAPGSEARTGVMALLFTENWEFGGRLTKLARTLVHGRNTLVRFSEPLSLQALADSETSSTPEAALLTRKLERILRVHFRQRRIATLGPDRSHRRTLLNQVMADDGVRLAVKQDAEARGRYDDTRSRKRARRYATEIAANVSYATISILDAALTRLWTKLYDGIEIDGIERLQAVADGNEIVYVPCHRSHIDYLLLSYILVKQGFSLPHVAAGINLNLPVIGGVLRRGGAFFLRRSFAGQPLYSAVFNAYLKEILQRGHAIEYFIEGGRSRTGRLLPAKAGMLSMTANAYLQDPRTPVVFVPVYFGYERLIEGRAFTSELAGGKKQKESIFGLLRSLKSLRESYGRVYVNVGDPIPLDRLLDAHRPGWSEEAPPESRPAWLTPVVEELGTRILGNINAAASVTPISLLAIAVLATRHGRVDHRELKRQLELYTKLLHNTQTGGITVVPTIDADEVIRHGHELGYLETQGDRISELVAVRSGQAGVLTYFRNNILHLLTLPSLIAAAFLRRPRRSREEIDQIVETTLPFLHTELFLPNTIDTATIDQVLHAMKSEGLLQHQTQQWQRAPADDPAAVSLQRLGQVVIPSIERYYLCTTLLTNASGSAVNASIELEVLSGQCVDCADRLAATEGRNVVELHDAHLFGQFIDALIERGLIHREGGRLTPQPSLKTFEKQAQRLLDEGMCHAILRASMAKAGGSGTTA